MRHPKPRPPRLTLAVHRAHVHHFHVVRPLDRILDLMLVRFRVHLKRIRIPRLLLMRALLGDQRLDDDICLLHVRCDLKPKSLPTPPSSPTASDSAEYPKRSTAPPSSTLSDP